MRHDALALVWCELIEFYDADAARQWLRSPHPQLKGRKPIDCSYAEVMVIIDQLKAGAFV